MAGLIRREDIDLVRARTDIKDVIEQHVTLRTSGVNSFKGLCPFHDERTPSFSVNVALGQYHCFGCGVGGDVFSFLQKVEHLSFAEAVTKLAAAAGIEVHYEDGSSQDAAHYSQRQRLLDMHKIASEFYAEQLAGRSAHAAREFLARRGFDRDATEHFGLGYAPQGWEQFLKYAHARGFTQEELRSSGLFSSRREGGSLYDRFRGRLLWPIRSVAGEVLGFGARKLSENDPGPKYLNTPETALYHKSQVLYGLDLARTAVARERKLVVVEGYTDVMACHLAGFTYTVATCGTAFGPDHVRLVQRLLSHDPASEIVFTFDGDEAGQQAALRAFELDRQFLASTYVALEPHGLDPCEVRMKAGAAGIRQLLQARVPLVEFALRVEVAKYENQLSSVEGRLAALRAGAEIIARIPDALAREHHAVQLAGWLGVMDPAEVSRAVARAQPATGGPAPPRRGGAGGDRGAQEREQRFELERQVLQMLIQHPQVWNAEDWAQVREANFTHPEYADMRTVLLSVQESVGQQGVSPVNWLTLLQEKGGPDLGARMTELALLEAPVRAEDVSRYCSELLRRLRGLEVRAQIADKLAQLHRADAAHEADRYRQLQVELMELQRQQHALRES